MYSSCHDCKVTLMVFPEKVNPNIISNILNIIPTEIGIKDNYRESYKGRKFKILRSSWFLDSEDYVESEDLQCHLAWIISILNNREKLPFYIQKKIEEIPLLRNKDTEIGIGISCTWNPVQDHGGPILSPKIMNAVAKVDVQFSIEPYFVYDISMVFSFMEAGRLLGVGQGLAYEDWMHLLAFIKIVHNVAPSTLGAIYDTGDFRDDDGNLICNIKDYIS